MTNPSAQPFDDSANGDRLAAQAKRALTPVTPSAQFRARLREGLRLAASYRETRDLVVRQRAETAWGWLVSAAAIGSAAGLVAVLLRARHRAGPAECREIPRE